jgi:pilus assembly protein Flp/PilA
MRIARILTDFVKKEEGPTAVEYAIMLALIISVCFAAISLVGNNVDETMETVSSTGLKQTGS